MRFDDAGLVSCAGLVPVLRLAEDIGLGGLIEQRVDLGIPVGANTDAKALSVVAGMVAGADSIEDLDVIRHGGMRRLFTGLRAPSTCGSWLRGFTHGHVGQLASAVAEALVRLAGRVPSLLAGVEQLAFIDIDSKIKETYGHGKQGSGFAYNGVRGLNHLVATLSSPVCAPVVLTARLRGGNADSRRGAASMITEAIGLARRAGATGTVVVRADSAFFTGPIITAIRKAGAWFSVTAQKNVATQAVIDRIDEDQWDEIAYRHPIPDPETGELITHAEIAETTLTAFTNTTQNPGRQVTARLLVRRTPRFKADAQGELFRTWNYHAVFTDTGFDLHTADDYHRKHAIIEQVFADLNAAALAHFPSGRFPANHAWLILACLTHNLLRATGCLTSGFHAKARTATLRRHLIAIPARITRTARRITLRLPANWPWQTAYQTLFTATHRTT
ncbi:IS1380 family transposase [Amycolatopsis keratiniphila]|uniref:IS1380 family transposase n=1 Tax=Amycolatopsis keratiniphila TaxID=129921 RepID=UPI002B400348|nr:IS1380 family transposase [Amycolatopsis keratiniphila]